MTTHKNQVGQDGTDVNGGEFAKKTQTEPDVALPADTTQHEPGGIRLTRLLKQRVELDAQVAQARLTIIGEEVLARFPSATTALIVRTEGWGNGWELSSVLDGDHNTLWRFDSGDSDENDWEFYNLVRYELLALAETEDLVPNIPAVRDTTVGPALMHSDFFLYQSARSITVPHTTQV